MLYQSTRNEKITADSIHAVLQGPAPDGGLYIDLSLDRRPFDWQGCLSLPPLDIAQTVLSHLLPDFDDMGALVKAAYEGKFRSDKLTPLVPVGEDFVLELFHGPTCAFKDVALSMLPRLITAARKQTGAAEKTLILTATSGDTGKAALEGFHDVPGTGIIVFYPADGVSPIQQAQMVTQSGENVKVCALRGNFDDCQRGVKEAFLKLPGTGVLETEGCTLSSANSINIGRLAPQVAYYFIAYSQLLDFGRIKMGDQVDYVVPTGNFGDILAGYYARMMGLPVGRLVCASNANRVLTDFFKTGLYDRRREFYKTSSPSMDILVSSNLERLLFLAAGGDTAFVRRCMEGLSQQGFYKVDDTIMQGIRQVFFACCCDEAETKATIARVWQDMGYLCDPHTAVAFFGAEQYKKERQSKAPLVILSTASPYKFPSAVLEAIGGELSGDDFDRMAELERISGVPAPESLARLRSAEVLHRDVIYADGLLSYISSCVKNGEV